MFVNAIIKAKKPGQPWRMYRAWLDRATGTDKVHYWIHCPDLCPCSWGTWETLTLNNAVIRYRIVENWAEDFQGKDWGGESKGYEISLVPRRHGLEISLQDCNGFSYMAVSPKQAREMSNYMAAWAASHGE